MRIMQCLQSLLFSGLQYGAGAPGGQHVHVRYDDSGSESKELDEISIHQ